MADSKEEKATGPRTTDDAKLAGSQPTIGAQEPDSTKASPDAAYAAQMASAQPTGNVVAMVTRDVDGNPRESENFVVLIPEGASQDQIDAAWNRAGEAQGAKHLKHGGGEWTINPVTGVWGGPGGFSDKELAERAKVERRELHRHNFREELTD